MEFFAVNYDKHFMEFIETIIDLQEILGDIHDNDVVLEALTNYKENRQSTELPGVDTLIARTIKSRNADYQAFLERWEQLSAVDFKQKLLAMIAS